MLQQIADLINCDPKEIIFTSGATECNNIAVKGVARFYRAKKNKIITTQTVIQIQWYLKLKTISELVLYNYFFLLQEHKCVLDSCRALEGEGFNVTYLPVASTGLLNLTDLKNAITPQTSLVSVMAVNNEIGVKQPLKEIGELLNKNSLRICIQTTKNSDMGNFLFYEQNKNDTKDQ